MLEFLKFIIGKNFDNDDFILDDIEGEAGKFLGNIIPKKDKDKDKCLRAFMELDRILSGDLTEEEAENEGLRNAIRAFNGLGQETDEYEDELNELKEYYRKIILKRWTKTKRKEKFVV